MHRNFWNEGDWMSVICIIGAGMMGSAMSQPLIDNGHEVRLVGTPLDHDIIVRVQTCEFHPTLERDLSKSIKAYQVHQMAEALDGADAVIGGISSFGIPWFADSVLPLLAQDPKPVLLVTKGLQPDDQSDSHLQPFPLYLEEQARKMGVTLSVGAIGGPCISFELVDRRQTHVCFCGSNWNSLEWWKETLGTAYYHISLSQDIVGVETAVAMKNAYAVGVALSIGQIEAQTDGMTDAAYNPQAALFGQSSREMQRLVQLMHGEMTSSMYGVADLYVTVFGGRTRRLGILLGKGLSFKDAKRELAGVTLEAVAIITVMANAVRQWIDNGQTTADQFPLLLHLDAIINREAKLDVPWESFTLIKPSEV